MATLGQKLRELRHQKGYKLNEVAKGAGLSISFISLIERDKASISVENLQKLANFYNTRLFQIFQDIEEEEAFVIRGDQIEDLALLGLTTKPSLFLLSPEENLYFKAILAELPPGYLGEDIRLEKGETFILIREGQVEITLPNKKPMILSEDDSVHLTSFKSTSLKNADMENPAKFLIVASATTHHLDKEGNLLGLMGIAK